MTRNGLIAIFAAGALAAGGITAAWWPTPEQLEDKTWQGLAIADCAQALIDDQGQGNVVCDAGDVVVRVRWTGDVPAGYAMVEEPAELVYEELPAPVPQPLGSQCIAGKVRKDTSEAGDQSQWRTWTRHVCCELSRCQCRNKINTAWLSAEDGLATGACSVAPPVEISGRETWEVRLSEVWEGQMPP
jgi:hypothetical protein